KPGPATIDYKVSLRAGDPGRTMFETPPRTPSVPLRDAYREIDRILLDKYAPSGLVLNDTLDIVQFRGDAGAGARTSQPEHRQNGAIQLIGHPSRPDSRCASPQYHRDPARCSVLC